VGGSALVGAGIGFWLVLQKWGAKGEDFTTKTLQLLGIHVYYLAI